MMKKQFLIWAFLLAVLACRKPYDPPAVTANTGYLVVQGVINPGSDSTIIMVSRTVNISSKNVVNPVTGASVSVQSDQNNSYPLTESATGTYISTGLNLDKTHQYRLNIKTSDGKSYQSDLEPVIITPPIDSVGYNIINTPQTGVNIYVNTHDPSNTIKYYRWDYAENWEFHSEFVSNFVSTGSSLVERGPGGYVSNCYSADNSSDIVIGSSAKLAQPVIYQNLLAFLPSTSEKLETRYRILVHQYALSNGAYNFWLNLKKNTEQLGSIFDAQPSQAPGNIRCLSNPSEQVVGYISVSTVATKIAFIYESNLPAWIAKYPYSCTVDSAKLGSPQYFQIVDFPQTYLATDPFQNNYISPAGYLYTSRECADCTIRGTVVPPPFWR